MSETLKCPICQGTGFKDGKICICITNKDRAGKPIQGDEDVLDFFKTIFGKGDTDGA